MAEHIPHGQWEVPEGWAHPAGYMRQQADNTPATTNYCQILLAISGKQKTPLALFTKKSAQIPTTSMLLSDSQVPKGLLGTEIDKTK